MEDSLFSAAAHLRGAPDGAGTGARATGGHGAGGLEAGSARGTLESAGGAAGTGGAVPQASFQNLPELQQDILASWNILENGQTLLELVCGLVPDLNLNFQSLNGWAISWCKHTNSQHSVVFYDTKIV